MGAVMSMHRRLELLQWAQKSDAWIIEDDYDSEFRYAGKPMSSLQGIDRHGSVIDVGTVSKVFFPGLRLGYAVVPRSLIDICQGAKYLNDRAPPLLQQPMMAEFMRQGHLTSHIRRMRQVYRGARDLLVGEINRQMGSRVATVLPDAGMQLVVYLPPGTSDLDLAEAARQKCVSVRPLSPLYVAAQPRSGLILGFSGFEPVQLRAATSVLGKIVKSSLRASGRKATQ